LALRSRPGAEAAAVAVTASDDPAARQRVYFDDLYGFFKRFVEHDTSRLTLLDFGCGTRGYVKLYNEHFGRCLALDIIDYPRRYSREGIEFVLSDGLTIPLADRSVDVVVSHSTLEHVEDLGRTIGELNRILVEGGYVYLTVSPLYFSPSGGHLSTATGLLGGWVHLDPESRHYVGVDDAPAQNDAGHPLNKLTSARFLAEVGKQPWEIMTYVIKPQIDRPLPDFLRAGGVSRLDLYLREFRFIARKVFSVVDDEIVMA
jgi:SAM-dependent methyltransferase